MTVTAPERRVIERARRARATEQVAHLDYVRAVVEVRAQGLTQTEIARELGVSQPAVSQLLSSAGRTAGAVREGFSGGSPYEICERYAAGQIDRARVVDELARWPYEQGDPGDGFDWLTYEPGEWHQQVVPALDEGLLDDATYDAVLDRRSTSVR